jgi:cell division protein FtsZ
VIARLCREQGYLTVGIVTIPFRSEGKRRINQAIDGIKEIEQYVDSLLVINNERIREMYGDFPISQAFAKADDVLAIAAKGIAEIITVHGYINVEEAWLKDRVGLLAPSKKRWHLHCLTTTILTAQGIFF